MALLLKTKAKPQFDKAVIRQSTPLFCLVSGSNLVVFLSCRLFANLLAVFAAA